MLNCQAGFSGLKWMFLKALPAALLIQSGFAFAEPLWQRQKIDFKKHHLEAEEKAHEKVWRKKLYLAEREQMRLEKQIAKKEFIQNRPALKPPAFHLPLFLENPPSKPLKKSYRAEKTKSSRLKKQIGLSHKEDMESLFGPLEIKKIKN